MADFSSLQQKVNALKAKVEQNSITPSYLGAILDDFITQIKAVESESKAPLSEDATYNVVVFDEIYDGQVLKQVKSPLSSLDEGCFVTFSKAYRAFLLHTVEDNKNVMYSDWADRHRFGSVQGLFCTPLPGKLYLLKQNGLLYYWHEAKSELLVAGNEAKEIGFVASPDGVKMGIGQKSGMVLADIPIATSDSAGMITAADKNKIDSMDDGSKAAAKAINNAAGLTIAPLEAGKIPARYIPGSVDDVKDFFGFINSSVTVQLLSSSKSADDDGCDIVYSTVLNALLLRDASGSSVLYFNNWINADSFGSQSPSGRIPEADKIYLATSTDKVYRWSGSQLAEIPLGVALGYTSSTAFPGSEGAALRDKVDSLTLMTEAEADQIINAAMMED